MNHLNQPSTSKQDNTFDDDEIFEDSAFLANFDNTSFNKQNNISSNNLNTSANTSALNVSALCCDEEISGYDKLTGKTWIYPTNYPVRDYQFNIIKAAILKNTLVSLPTGLGKTFIAAVVMYNFYRWYPLGKIVFTAPTRPLVAQQIDACYNIIAIPPNDTIEMTGHMQVNTRKAHWESKRVFFATPQVIYNDLKSGICPADKIRCLVIDEAHKARGNYAYCQIVATLDEMGHKTYRMLALSATPGSKVEDVINVVKSLHIAHLELRTENCIDVAPYSHSRKINTEIVKLGPELTQLRQQYVEILDFYARRLKQFNILPQNLGNLSKGRIVMLYKEYQTKDRGSRHPQHNYIMKDFTLLIALYHGLELLVKHGSRVFLNFFDEHPEKTWIQSDDKLTALLERLRDDLGVNPLSLDRSILPDGTIPELPKDLCFGHPKFDRLKSIIVEHFTRAKQNNQDTRAIIFCEYRESVNLVHCLLLQCRPLITPQMFVGQGASGKDGKAVVSQKQQLRVMRNFRSGASNTLVATCVAEEGLDVGSVDLILCFDISTRSPIRLVQRCGRTGRERGGQVYILVTEGREHQTLMDCMRQRDGLNKRIQQSKEVKDNLYQLNPRMMPHGFTPECHKMYITVAKKDDSKDKDNASKKGQKNLRTMLLNNRASSSGANAKEADKNCLITEAEFTKLFPDGYHDRKPLRSPDNYWAMNKDTLKTRAMKDPGTELKLSNWLDWQRTPQKTVNVAHSKDTEFLVNLLQKCDAKRLEPTQNLVAVASTQELLSQRVSPILNSQTRSPVKTAKQTKKKQKTVGKSPAKNYGDIRALFCTATKSTKNYTKLINDLGIQNDGSVSTRLINLLVDLNLNVDSTSDAKACYICQNMCDCKTLQNAKKGNTKPVLIKILNDPILPDLDLIDDIDVDTIKKYRMDMNTSEDSFKCDAVNTTTHSLIDEDKHNGSNNFDLGFDFDELDELKSPEDKVTENKAEANVSTEKNFDLGDIDDIFAISSPEEALEQSVEVKEPVRQSVDVKTNKVEPKDIPAKEKALNYFGLDSLEDIFADDEDDVIETSKVSSPQEQNKYRDKNSTNKNQEQHRTPKKTNEITNPKTIHGITASVESFQEKKIQNSEYPLSPSILSGRQRVKNIPTSPILCSQPRRFPLSIKKKMPNCSTPNTSVRKKLMLPDIENNVTIPDEKNNHKTSDIIDTTDRSMFTVTQLVEIINKTDKSLNQSNVKETVNAHDERCTSPILLTQADRKRNTTGNVNNKSNRNKTESLIILSSDTDSNDTVEHDIEEELKKNSASQANQSSNQMGVKRKHDSDDEVTASPHFNKKAKLDRIVANNFKPKETLTVQEKILATISSTKTKTFTNNQINLNVTVSQPNFSSQKENKVPQRTNSEHFHSSPEERILKPLDTLQKFRKGNELQTLKKKFDSIFIKKSPENPVTPPKKNIFEDCNDFMFDDEFISPKNCATIDQREYTPVKRNLYFGESDEDFIDNKNGLSPRKPLSNSPEIKTTSNHKLKKKKRKATSFIDMEASLSDREADSGDELTDDSVGSIADFICDDVDITRQEDIHAVYLKSVRSPVKKNGFKIPELPKKYKKEDVFSQFVAEDAYEMDSFCVDSHIGLTQANDLSELELAEIVLEEKRRSKKKGRRRSPEPQENCDSPVIRKTKKTRQISSDSDDSS